MSYQYEDLDHRGVLPSDPIEAFKICFDLAKVSEPSVPDAMILATATKQGRPSARTVLLKGFGRNGFLFYTNTESPKARELDENPFAALTFHWRTLGKQVRIEGLAERISEEESWQYFSSRPLESRLAAWASPQSRPISGRKFLLERIDALKAKYVGREVPLPPVWGGYRVIPDRIEFWFGRPGRLHDRFSYIRQNTGIWKRIQLAP